MYAETESRIIASSSTTNTFSVLPWRCSFYQNTKRAVSSEFIISQIFGFSILTHPGLMQNRFCEGMFAYLFQGKGQGEKLPIIHAFSRNYICYLRFTGGDRIGLSRTTISVSPAFSRESAKPMPWPATIHTARIIEKSRITTGTEMPDTLSAIFSTGALAARRIADPLDDLGMCMFSPTMAASH